MGGRARRSAVPAEAADTDAGRDRSPATGPATAGQGRLERDTEGGLVLELG